MYHCLGTASLPYDPGLCQALLIYRYDLIIDCVYVGRTVFINCLVDTTPAAYRYWYLSSGRNTTLII
jgi:hypothetical protein